jgi:spore coat protein U-like protein
MTLLPDKVIFRCVGAQSFSVFGRIPTQTTPAPGSYADIITVTVTY